MSQISESDGVKAIQLHNGTFKVGSGPLVIVLLGSCRIVPYLNVFHALNGNNRFTIHMINVVNFMFDQKGIRVDTEALVSQYENRQDVRKILESTQWFIHEHLEHYGMFNSSQDSSKNIYQFGMKPEIDVGIPNFHDLFVLFRDQLRYDAELRKQAELDLDFYKRLSDELQQRIKENGLREIEKFISLCPKTSIPEIGTEFENTWRSVRYFWTTNHITNHFTSLVLKLINRKFLKLEVEDAKWYDLLGEDIYRTPHTHLTQYDVDNFALSWNEPVVDIRPIPVP